jgi:dTMP kinase
LKSGEGRRLTGGPKRRGMFIVFEGADGVGKSTQVKLLAAHLEKTRGLKTLLVREPGGTELGERIREILLSPATGDLDVATETLLFMAARSHLTSRVVAPALGRGEAVICDRYLWSTVVYQGIVGRLGAEEVLRIGRMAGAIPPDRTLVLDVPPRIAFGRLAGRDRMEIRGPRYQEEVRRAFLHLARRHPRNAAVIDGRGTAEEVHRRVLLHLPRPKAARRR